MKHAIHVLLTFVWGMLILAAFRQIPHFEYLTDLVQSPSGFIALVIGPAFLLAGWELKSFTADYKNHKTLKGGHQ